MDGDGRSWVILACIHTIHREKRIEQLSIHDSRCAEMSENFGDQLSVKVLAIFIKIQRHSAKGVVATR